jgi:transcriptional regulator with XRE-family HTH domain
MLHILIKEQRLRKGWSIRQLALYTGVHHSRLAKFELGKSDIGSKQMLLVMLMLDFTISTGEGAIAIEAANSPSHPPKLIVQQ